MFVLIEKSEREIQRDSQLGSSKFINNKYKFQWRHSRLFHLVNLIFARQIIRIIIHMFFDVKKMYLLAICEQTWNQLNSCILFQI